MTESIKVAALLPLTGPLGLYGQQAKLGLDLALKEINQAGGILDRPLELSYRDAQIEPESAEQEAADLVNLDGLLAIVGPFTSSSLNRVLPICQSHKVPLLYASNYEGGQNSRYFFCFSTVPNQELSSLLPYVHESFGDSYFMVGADKPWPHKMFQAAEPIIAALGGRVVGKEFTLGSESDFTPLIQRVADSKAKILVFALKGDGLRFIPQAHSQGLFKTVKVAYLGLSETDLDVFKGKGEDMYTVVPFLQSSQEPDAVEFVARVRADAPGANVSHLVLSHYNTLLALKAALEKAGRCDREALIDALEGLEIPTPTGPVTIGADDHHATLNMYLARTQGQDLLMVRELGKISPSLATGRT